MNLDELSKATRCPLANIEECWPAICDALRAESILDYPTMVAALGTIAIETAWTFLPIREFGSDSYFTKMYDHRLDIGNTMPGDGARYCGRGFIQITGKYNYLSYGHDLGIDLIGNPDLALIPHVAAMILARFFKSRKIPVVAATGDWPHVRRLVNGGVNGLEPFLKVTAAVRSLSEVELLP